MNNIDASDLNKIMKYFDKSLARLAQPKPFFKRAGKNQLERNELNFLNGTDPDGQPWESLSASTLERKISSFPLIESGELFDSLEFNASNKGWTVGTDNDYAEYHQFGTDTIPARPFLGFTEEGVEEDVEWIFTTIFPNT